MRLVYTGVLGIDATGAFAPEGACVDDGAGFGVSWIGPAAPCAPGSFAAIDASLAAIDAGPGVDALGVSDKSTASDEFSPLNAALLIPGIDATAEVDPPMRRDSSPITPANVRGRPLSKKTLSLALNTPSAFLNGMLVAS